MITPSQIQELEAFFDKVSLPKSLELGPGEMIDDVKKFLDSHLQVIKNYPHVQTYDAFYLRLVKVKNLLSENGSITP